MSDDTPSDAPHTPSDQTSDKPKPAGRKRAVTMDPRTWSDVDDDLAGERERDRTPDRAVAEASRTKVTPETGSAQTSAWGGPARSYAVMIGGLVAALLLGGAAFALWPASVEEAADEQAATEADAQPPVTTVQSLAIGSLDELAQTLELAGADPADARSFATRAASEWGSLSGAERLVLARSDAALLEIEVTTQDGSGLQLTRSGESISVNPISARLESRLTFVRGVMDDDSFYTSAVKAGVNNLLIDDFANAFSFDFDMQRDVQPGDVFEALIAQDFNPSGKPVGLPELRYVSMRTNTDARALYRFTPQGETEPGWFDDGGQTTVRALMRTPLNGARITSRFGPRRHPIKGYNRIHRGTDYGAPTGTPVFAAADGVVLRKAYQARGAGNYIVLRHDNGWDTKYFHLNAYAPGIEAGQRVNQGDVIGEVGNTGGSTGPHLHFEVWIEGKAVDSTQIDTGEGKTLSDAVLGAFKEARDAVDVVRVEQAGLQ
ncbi:MAG: M23 family metallopeptidase [Pseudomonadota bacterium]